MSYISPNTDTDSIEKEKFRYEPFCLVQPWTWAGVSHHYHEHIYLSCAQNSLDRKYLRAEGRSITYLSSNSQPKHLSINVILLP